jgi:hypothetical protein
MSDPSVQYHGVYKYTFDHTSSIYTFQRSRTHTWQGARATTRRTHGPHGTAPDRPGPSPPAHECSCMRASELRRVKLAQTAPHGRPQPQQPTCCAKPDRRSVAQQPDWPRMCAERAPHPGRSTHRPQPLQRRQQRAVIRYSARAAAQHRDDDDRGQEHDLRRRATRSVSGWRGVGLGRARVPNRRAA